ncbi:GGDEF domain-containing protein [Planctomycetota bacterium]
MRSAKKDIYSNQKLLKYRKGSENTPEGNIIQTDDETVSNYHNSTYGDKPGHDEEESHPKAEVNSDVETLNLLQDLAHLETRLRKLQTKDIDNQALLSQIKNQCNKLRQDLDFEKNIRYNLGEMVQRSSMVTSFCQQIGTLDGDAIVSTSVSKIPHIIGAKYVAFYFYDYEFHELVLKEHSFNFRLKKKIDLDSLDCLPITRALSKNECYLVQDQLEFDFILELILDEEVDLAARSNSLILVPLSLGGITVGMLTFFEKIDGEVFDDKLEVPLIEQMRASLSASIRNSQLFKEVRERARNDGLTGLYNHSTFFEELRKEAQRTKRYGSPLTMLVIDLDNFKEINDNHGHAVGDGVLRGVASLLRATCRSLDVISRYGGDEFTILLPETNLEGGMVLARRLQAKVDDVDFEIDDGHYSIRCSVGVAEYNTSMSQNGFFKAADEALYKAKAAGKAQVVSYQ